MFCWTRHLFWGPGWDLAWTWIYLWKSNQKVTTISFLSADPRRGNDCPLNATGWWCIGFVEPSDLKYYVGHIFTGKGYTVKCSLLNQQHREFSTNCELYENPPECTDVAVPVLVVGAWVSTVGLESQGGKKLGDTLGDLWIMVGLEERILKTLMPERHLFYSWAPLPISLHHLPSPLSYKSQGPLLFQPLLRERGVLLWIHVFLLDVLKQ